MPVTRRWLTQSHGDELCFRLAIELAGGGWFRAFLAVESQLEAFVDKAFAEVLDCLYPTIESLGDFGIRPARPICVRLQQYLCTTKPL